MGLSMYHLCRYISSDVSATFFVLVKIVKKIEPLFILKDAFIKLAIEAWRLSRLTEELIGLRMAHDDLLIKGPNRRLANIENSS
tara:strand:+ start:334 stop:585 length:252 start_codon:yes stop_codon:yes gene_type:complete